MEIFKEQNIIAFGKAFPKWRDGFVCKKCGHHSGRRKARHTYHCYRCNHVESATARTLFHSICFGLRKIFHIVFEMTGNSKGMFGIQVGLRYGIRQPTAWPFIHKARPSSIPWLN